MPGPFPGMDPYLEDPLLWRGLHLSLIFCITEAINAQLPADYIANIDERVYVVQPEHTIYPDVAVIQRPRSSVSQTGSVAMAEEADSSVVLAAYPIEITEGFIEIRSARRPNRVVTIIEILSPFNKAAGSEGRQDYLQKQREILQSETNLLEIDLLRHGAHTVAVPLDTLRTQGNWNYLVCLHRSFHRYHYETWMISLRRRLPRIKIPLLEGEPEITLNLQEAFNRCYDAIPYARQVDYRADPPIPLQSEDADWADALLREKGLRP